ncbi:hypothetical protein Leryth_010731 [Lithospermum erythrorhizon]|nr:hypothetical protein Leryth_010731 [Lithospermum erythrorhizon]
MLGFSPVMKNAGSDLCVSLCSEKFNRQRQKAALKQKFLSKSSCQKFMVASDAISEYADDTEVAIEKYFNSVDKDAEMIMEVQLKEEEKNMKEMMKIMQKQALLEKTEAEVISDKHNADGVKNKASS